MDKFMFRKRKALSSHLCDSLIEFYESNPNKQGNRRNYTMLQLLLSDFPDVFNPLNDSLNRYKEQHNFLENLFHEWGWSNGFHLQKYEVGECYDGEHMEHGAYEYDCRRILGWMVYLNDCSGGTCFPQQRFTTKPKQGDLYIWPAGWTHSHYGLPSKQEKYILTGWCEMYKSTL